MYILYVLIFYMYIPFAHTARNISYVLWLRSMFRRSACEVGGLWRKKTRPALGECLAATLDLPGNTRLLTSIHWTSM